MTNPISQQYSGGDTESLSSALANLTLQGDLDPLQLLPDNGNGYTNRGNKVEGPEGFLVESSVRSTRRNSNEPLGNGSSFPVADQTAFFPTVQKLQTLTSEQNLDWNSTVQATHVDRPSVRYFQAQQSPFEDCNLPQVPILPVARSKQSARKSLSGSDLQGNGFQVNAVPEDLLHDGQVLAYLQQQKLQRARQGVLEGHQQQFRRPQAPEPQSTACMNLHNQGQGPFGSSLYSHYFPGITVPGIPHHHSSDHHQAGAMAAMFQTGWSQPDTSSVIGLKEHGDQFRYYAQGHCLRGNTCPFLHSYGESGAPPSSLEDTLVTVPGGQAERIGTFFPKKILNRPSSQSNGNYAVIAARRRKIFEESGHLVANGDAVLPVTGKPSVQQLSVLDDDGIRSSMKFTTLEEVEGRIYDAAKDQHGCRFLQRKFDEGKPEDVNKIFEEIRDHLVVLMTDPFGNYLVQKLLEVCNEVHRMEILEAVTKNDDLVNISLNMHGTRAVQKLIETLQTTEQISMAIKSLKQGVVTLMKDLNGNHVVQRCLQHLNHEDSQFIFDAAASHCVEIASHRHGCCVLQRCVDFASGMQRQYLVAEIAANALVLSQDPFGNYVVQYVLELGLAWATAEVMSRLEGSYPLLAMQKFSSNVVEKCLKFATEDKRACIVKELITSSALGQLLQDPYANYVIQSALQATKGPLHMSLVDAIRPHVPVLRSSPYGKRILSRTHLKK